MPEALKQIKIALTKAGYLSNGWRINTTAIGTYGTDSLHREAIAYGGYGANTIDDALYPMVFADADGQPPAFAAVAGQSKAVSRPLSVGIGIRCSAV